MAVHHGHRFSIELSVVGGVVMGMSGKRQAASDKRVWLWLLELVAVVVHHRPSSSVESWLLAVGDGIQMDTHRVVDSSKVSQKNSA